MSFKRRLFVARSVSVGRNFHIGMLSWIGAPERLEIGDDVYIGKFCTIQCSGRIGDGVLIGNNVGIVGRRDHEIREVGRLVSRSNSVGGDPGLARHPRNRITIGCDVWVGYGATLLSGITIGRGAVIGAGAVVRRDVAPYDIVAGNPAVPVGRRFTDAEIVDHEARIAARTGGP